MKSSILTLILLLGLVTSVWSLPYTGSINAGENGGMYATPNWNNSSTVLSWEIVQDVTTQRYTYDYTWTVGEVDDWREISHIIFQVSDTFTGDNIFDGTTGYSEDNFELGTYSGNNPSNPGMPGEIKGLKFDTDDLWPGENNLTYEYTIVTDRTPMWGNFYGKDGTFENADVYAYNDGFGSGVDLSQYSIMSGNLFDETGYGFVLVPDTTNGGNGGGGGGAPIPEPSTWILLGAGLVGLAFYRRKKH